MLRLTRRTVAELAVQGLLSAQLKRDLSAMAISLVAGIEFVFRLVDTVGRTLLPVVSWAFSLLLAGFGLVHVFLDVFGVPESGCSVE